MTGDVSIAVEYVGGVDPNSNRDVKSVLIWVVSSDVTACVTGQGGHEGAEKK